MPIVRLTSVLLVCLLSTSAAFPVDTVVSRTHAHPAFRTAAEALRHGYTQFIADTIALTEIPAPPFEEDRRGAAFLRMLSEAGLRDVERDAVGNVMGLRRGTGGPLVVVAAHLDTVFPSGTDVTVQQEGTRYMAPGIGDNSQGLALLLALIRAMDTAGARTTSDLLFVGNVGEEGPGNLRGVRHLFTSGKYRDRIATFISIDGAGTGEAIVNGAVGSERHRVTFTGPGGHSYGNFGIVNPVYALAAAIQKISAFPASHQPRTTFNVGRIGGGTSVNSVPSEIWMEVDLRSESAEELAALSARTQQIMDEAAAEENRTRSTAQGPVRVEVEVTGVRPAGATPVHSSLAEIAAAATRAVGGTPRFVASSTDANLPISLGIPAISIDTGMTGGRAHAPDEWIDVDPAANIKGQERALLLVMSLAGVR